MNANSAVAKLLREPLLHFLVLGAALFGVFALVGKWTAGPSHLVISPQLVEKLRAAIQTETQSSPTTEEVKAQVEVVLAKWADERTRIIISPGLIENMRESFRRDRKRPPNEDELHAAVEEYVREEILCREVRALELDRDDASVRRPLRKRIEEFQTSGVAALQPTDEQLRSFVQQNPGLFLDAQGRVPEWNDALRGEAQGHWLTLQRRQALDAAYAKLRARYVVEIPPSTAEKQP